MMRRAVVATAYLVLLTLPCFVAAKKLRLSNGIRLVGGSGPRGRLEISSTANWMLSEGEQVAWRPVCSVGGLMDNSMAQVMCKLLGYKYGRRYYTPDVAYRPPNASLPEQSYPVGYVYCNVNTRRRRLGGNSLVGGDDAVMTTTTTTTTTTMTRTAGERAQREHALAGSGSSPGGAEGVPSGGGGGGGGGGVPERRHRHARSLLAPLFGNVNTPPDAPYSCQFRLGDCAYTGPLVGIECFNRRMPPAPPPPPSPPSPPPAPPPGSNSIRLRGPNGGSLETNLCTATPSLCTYFNRVELQVAAPGGGGGLVWAPLCSPSLEVLQALGDVACWQAYNWPRFAPRPDFIVISEPSELGFPIPKATNASTPSYGSSFDPSKVAAWVTVNSSRKYDTALRVQDLDMQVSSTPCETGALFAISCTRRSRR